MARLGEVTSTQQLPVGGEPRRGTDTFWPIPGFVDRTLGRFDQAKVTWVITAIAATIAFLIRWTQDDSYISLRYARNLVEGRGLVYNPGEYVEGYTNFLWTILMAVPLRLGRDPVLFGHIVSITCMAITIVVVTRLASRVFGSRVLGNLTVVVLLTNFTFVAYGTGGLETQMQTALVALVWLVALPALMPTGDPLRIRDLVLLSIFAGLAELTRLDSAVILAVPIVAVFWSIMRSHAARPSKLMAFITPAAILVVPWTVWRVLTYGSLIPNTATAKANPLATSVLQGGSFLVLFIGVNLLFVFAPTAAVHGRELLRRPPFALVLVALSLWVLYLLKVGADFMEFRFMVVTLPLLSLTLVGLIILTKRVAWQKLMLAALGLGMVVHLAFMGGRGGAANVDSAENLDGFVTESGSGFITLGRELGSVLHGSSAQELRDSGAPTIAMGGAGAVPYFARLRNVDPFGLTDPWTAEHGIQLDAATLPKQGHARMATFRHLLDEGVNLFISGKGAAPKPGGYDANDLRGMYKGSTPDSQNLSPGTTMIEIPMPDGSVWAGVYLKHHPDIDAAVKSGRWLEVPLNP